MRCLFVLAVALVLSGSAVAQNYVVFYPAPVVMVQPATVVYRPMLRPMLQVPTTVYYAPPITTPAPVNVYTTRYRPLLGGSITRVRTYYPPSAFVTTVPATYYGP